MSRIQRCLACLMAAALSACAQPARPPTELPYAPQSRAVASPIIYSFGKGYDGAYPAAELVFHGGLFYGTTMEGGKNRTGTVFSITSAGKERVLHSFGPAGGGDGQAPGAGLVYANGNLYGVTEDGGAYGMGAVFSITPAGKEKVIYSFAGQPNDGAGPAASLLYYRGLLWGTTMYGGANQNLGTMFSVTLDGHETVVHQFGSGTDGNTPSAPLVVVTDNLYGTTLFGSVTQGTLFSYNVPRKHYAVIHQFDYQGERPNGLAFGPNNMLYGITGGAPNAVGTFFSSTLQGKVKTLYTFLGPNDITHPFGTVATDGNDFYFTGAENGVYGNGGLVKVSAAGQETILYSFGAAGPNDGKQPSAGPILAGGNLYGTTRQGGVNPYNGFGAGTVYKIRP